jgi:hypothetical protein
MSRTMRIEQIEGSRIEQPLAPGPHPSTHKRNAIHGDDTDGLSVGIRRHVSTAVIEPAGSRRAELRVWYARLRPKLALAVRDRRVSTSQAAAFDRTMRELLDLRKAAQRGRGVL